MNYDDRPWLASYDSGIPADIAIPERTYTDLLLEGFSNDPGAPAVVYMDKVLTHSDMEYYSRRFAAYLAANRCGQGDVVALHTPNLPAYLIGLAGALRAGCAVTGVSALLTKNELAYQLNDSGAKVLVTWDVMFAEKVLPIQDEIPGVAEVLIAWAGDFLPSWKKFLGKVTGRIPSGRASAMRDKQVMYFSEAMTRYKAEVPRADISPDDTCLLMYTGGTTGRPKGTMLLHKNIVANIEQVKTWSEFKPGGEVMCSGFPFFHLAGLMFGMATLATGNCQCLVPDPRDTDLIARICEKYRPTLMANVPTLYKMLLDNPRFREVNHERLRVCISGAAPFAADDIRALESVVGGGKVLEVYGMTETSPVITANPYMGQSRAGSVGLPLPCTRVRLMDLEEGRVQVPRGEEGELVVNGPQVMAGYLNKPGETAHALREVDGETWLYTGDIARMDEDGFFYIVDRAKDMLVVGGYKVFSREVEEHLYEHPAVEFCAIVGRPNPEKSGSEIVVAVIQPSGAYADKDAETLKGEIMAFARERMAPYKVPRVVEFTGEMPLTNVGKVDKKALR
ncbi:MAG: AMP-binding protein [Desulfatibacillaceae bacterium]